MELWERLESWKPVPLVYCIQGLITVAKNVLRVDDSTSEGDTKSSTMS